jgi:hypothetical protein
LEERNKHWKESPDKPFTRKPPETIIGSVLKEHVPAFATAQKLKQSEDVKSEPMSSTCIRPLQQPAMQPAAASTPTETTPKRRGRPAKKRKQTDGIVANNIVSVSPTPAAPVVPSRTPSTVAIPASEEILLMLAPETQAQKEERLKPRPPKRKPAQKSSDV